MGLFPRMLAGKTHFTIFVQTLSRTFEYGTMMLARARVCVMCVWEEGGYTAIVYVQHVPTRFRDLARIPLQGKSENSNIIYSL